MKKTPNLSAVLLFTMLMVGTEFAVAQEPDPSELPLTTVVVPVAEHDDIGFGFGEGDGEVVYRIKFQAPLDGEIVCSDCIDNAGMLLWKLESPQNSTTRSQVHIWRADGVILNFEQFDEVWESHAARFHGEYSVSGEGGGGVGGPLEFDAAVADIDIDADSDNAARQEESGGILHVRTAAYTRDQDDCEVTDVGIPDCPLGMKMTPGEFARITIMLNVKKVGNLDIQLDHEELLTFHDYEANPVEQILLYDSPESKSPVPLPLELDIGSYTYYSYIRIDPQANLQDGNVETIKAVFVAHDMPEGYKPAEDNLTVEAEWEPDDLTYLKVDDYVVPIPEGAVPPLPVEPDPNAEVEWGGLPEFTPTWFNEGRDATDRYSYYFKSRFEFYLPGDNETHNHRVTVSYDVHYWVHRDIMTNDILVVEALWDSDMPSCMFMTTGYSGIVEMKPISVNLRGEHGEGGQGHIQTYESKAVMKVVKEVSESQFHMLTNLSTTGLQGREATYNTRQMTFSEEDINEMVGSFQSKLGNSTIVCNTSVSGGVASFNEANKIVASNVSLPPVGPVRRLVVESFEGKFDVMLFFGRLDNVEISMEGEGYIQANSIDLAKAEVTVEFGTPDYPKGRGDWELQIQNSIRIGVANFAGFNVTGALEFDVEAWRASLVNGSDGAPFQVTANAQVGALVGEDETDVSDWNWFATADLTVGETGKGVAKFELVGGNGTKWEKNGYCVEIERILLNAKANLTQDISFGLSDGSASGKVVLPYPFAGQRNDVSTIDMRCLIDNKGSMSVNITTDKLYLKVRTARIELERVGLDVTLNKETFVLEKFELSGNALARLPDAMCHIDLQDLLIQHDTATNQAALERFKASGVLDVGGFTFNVVDADYNVSHSSAFAFEAELDVILAQAKVFASSGKILYHTELGLREIAFDASVDFKAVTGDGSVNFKTSQSDWEAKGHLQFQLNTIDVALQASGAISEEGRGTNNPWRSMYMDASVTTGAGGIPLGPTGLFLNGVAGIAGYNRQCTFAEPGVTWLTGFRRVLHDKKLGHNHVGLGAGIAAAGDCPLNGKVMLLAGLASMQDVNNFLLEGAFDVTMLGGRVELGGTAKWNSAVPRISGDGAVAVYLPSKNTEGTADMFYAHAQQDWIIAKDWNNEITAHTGSKFGFKVNGYAQIEILREIKGEANWSLTSVGNGEFEGELTWEREISFEHDKEFTIPTGTFGYELRFNLDIKASANTKGRLSEFILNEFETEIETFLDSEFTMVYYIDALWGIIEHRRVASTGVRIGSEENPATIKVIYNRMEQKPLRLQGDNINISLEWGEHVWAPENGYSFDVSAAW